MVFPFYDSTDYWVTENIFQFSLNFENIKTLNTFKILYKITIVDTCFKWFIFTQEFFCELFCYECFYFNGIFPKKEKNVSSLFFPLCVRSVDDFLIQLRCWKFHILYFTKFFFSTIALFNFWIQLYLKIICIVRFSNEMRKLFC